MSKVIKLTREQLVRRLILIQDDVENIIEWCKLNGVDTTIDNLHGSSHDTFITNIMIASDVDVEGRCDEDNFRVELEWKCKATDEVLPFMSFESSWGSIDCDREGNILDINGEEEIGGEKNYLYGIKRINIDEYCEFLISKNITHGECDDILSVGFWREDGGYETPDADWRKNMFGEDEETYPIVNCMDCGHPQPLLEENVHVDNLGRHIICEECESSFNVGGDETPTQQCSNPETHDKVKQIINLLKTLDNGDCVDGETMEYILEQVGMSDQMLRQLVMNNPYTDTSDLLAEKVELDNQRVGRK